MKRNNLKILAIGNSFSVDAMQYLNQIAISEGYGTFVLGNLYIGGASLEQHVTEFSEGLKDYIYYKNVDGNWTEKAPFGLLEGIQDEDWDITTLQQVSHLSGRPESFHPFLEDLVRYVLKHAINPEVRLYWHMTWAYQSDSDHGGFTYYRQNQEMMYQAIIDTLRSEILTMPIFTDVIPSGTAIQNVRRTRIGDCLTRDGFHLSYDRGRWIASLCWFHKITGYPIDELEFIPEGVSSGELPDIVEAVQNAIKSPY